MEPLIQEMVELLSKSGPRDKLPGVLGHKLGGPF